MTPAIGPATAAGRGRPPAGCAGARRPARVCWRRGSHQGGRYGASRWSPSRLMRLPLRRSCPLVLRSGDLFGDTPNEDAVTPQGSFSGPKKLDPDSELRIRNQQRHRSEPRRLGSRSVRPRRHSLSALWAARRDGDSELAASSLPLRVPRRQSALGRTEQNIG